MVLAGVLNTGSKRGFRWFDHEDAVREPSFRTFVNHCVEPSPNHCVEPLSRTNAKNLQLFSGTVPRTMRPANLVCAIALVAAAGAQTALPRATPESVGLSTERLTVATDLLEQFVADQKIAGAVAAVVRQGKLAYLRAVGVQDILTRTPMSERTLFRIYSMTSQQIPS